MDKQETPRWTIYQSEFAKLIKLNENTVNLWMVEQNEERVFGGFTTEEEAITYLLEHVRQRKE